MAFGFLFTKYKCTEDGEPTKLLITIESPLAWVNFTFKGETKSAMLVSPMAALEVAQVGEPLNEPV